MLVVVGIRRGFWARNTLPIRDPRASKSGIWSTLVKLKPTITRERKELVHGSPVYFATHQTFAYSCANKLALIPRIMWPVAGDPP